MLRTFKTVTKFTPKNMGLSENMVPIGTPLHPVVLIFFLIYHGHLECIAIAHFQDRPWMNVAGLEQPP